MLRATPMAAQAGVAGGAGSIHCGPATQIRGCLDRFSRRMIRQVAGIASAEGLITEPPSRRSCASLHSSPQVVVELWA